jgi:hypothetical protein
VNAVVAHGTFGLLQGDGRAFTAIVTSHALLGGYGGRCLQRERFRSRYALGV